MVASCSVRLEWIGQGVWVLEGMKSSVQVDDLSKENGFGGGILISYVNTMTLIAIGCIKTLIFSSDLCCIYLNSCTHSRLRHWQRAIEEILCLSLVPTGLWIERASFISPSGCRNDDRRLQIKCSPHLIIPGHVSKAFRACPLLLRGPCHWSCRTHLRRLQSVVRFDSRKRRHCWVQLTLTRVK